jgi:pSer/pThr/pTyr-binding forkhead associated (FHA) protein
MSLAEPLSPTGIDAPTQPLDAASLQPRSLQRPSIVDAGRYLLIDDGEQRLVRLAPGVTHLGRGFTAQLRFEDDAVSRHHAVLVSRSRGTTLLDDRSANGTFLNGRRIVSAPLADGDVIAVGHVVLTFLEVGVQFSEFPQTAQRLA